MHGGYEVLPLVEVMLNSFETGGIWVSTGRGIKEEEKRKMG